MATLATPPEATGDGLRRRSAPASSATLSTLAADETASSSSSTLPTPPSSNSGDPSPPMRPTFSRTSTASSSSGGQGSPRFDLPDDDPLFSGLSLLDMLNVFDAHLELLTRPLRRKSVSWREKADRLLDEAKQRGKDFNLKPLGGLKMPEVPVFDLGLGEVDRKVLSQKDRERLERKYREVRARTRESLQKLVVKWEEEKTVRLRDKISFLCGVMNVLVSALLLGFHPTWLPAWYSVQMLFYMPYRLYTYKRKAYHYFLFDLCYFVNLLTLVYLWLAPSSTILFEACYGLTLGTLGTAIATWRNSLVFHSLDKVISLAIHIFPPLVFTVIRHFYPRDLALERYPALKELEHLRPWRTIAICMGVYTLWQLLYFHFVIQLRAEKIKEGRATSFTYMVNDKKRLIGKIAAKVPAKWREAAFMLGQAIYTFVTLLIPVFVLYDSKTWSSVYLVWMFATSVWNGASFYMEVFSRRFEKELLALRKEFDAQQALLNRYAANPGAVPQTPAASLTSDPIASTSSSSASETAVADEELKPTAKEGLELERSASGPPKVPEGDHVKEEGEGAHRSVQTKLGEVEHPGTAV
ncbi:hypothetical protein JCM10213_007724 [Rhodosporidiobolus nylandii]